jgi:cell division protein FtsB
MASSRNNARSIPQAIPGGNVPVVILIATLIVGVAALLPLVQNSLATSTGGAISDLEREREDWQARLHEQEVAVAQLGSLDRIEEQAKNRLHMVEPEDVTYITVDAQAPAPHKLPSRYLPPDEGQSGGGSSLLHDIISWIPTPWD